MKSTLFLNQISCVDHAYVDNKGHIVGGSWLPDVFVTGEVSDDESVVVDFSTIKKDIKNIIDDKEDGFDHKLLFVVGYSNGVQRLYVENEQDMIEIKTDVLTFTGPKNSVKIVYEIDYQEALRKHIEAELQVVYPATNISVIVNIKSDRVHGFADHSQHYFRYVHGLKSSTSWGCGNLAHGHLSFIEAIGGQPLANNMLLSHIVSQLDSVMFIYRENIISETDEKIVIGYDKTISDRGPFKIEFDPRKIRHAILETETTIEYLAALIEQTYGANLRSLGIQQLLVSEGLSKGSMIDLTSATE